MLSFLLTTFTANFKLTVFHFMTKNWLEKRSTQVENDMKKCWFLILLKFYSIFQLIFISSLFSFSYHPLFICGEFEAKKIRAYSRVLYNYFFQLLILSRKSSVRVYQEMDGKHNERATPQTTIWLNRILDSACCSSRTIN